MKLFIQNLGRGVLLNSRNRSDKKGALWHLAFRVDLLKVESGK